MTISPDKKELIVRGDPEIMVEYRLEDGAFVDTRFFAPINAEAVSYISGKPERHKTRAWWRMDADSGAIFPEDFDVPCKLLSLERLNEVREAVGFLPLTVDACRRNLNKLLRPGSEG